MTRCVDNIHRCCHPDGLTAVVACRREDLAGSGWNGKCFYQMGFTENACHYCSDPHCTRADPKCEEGFENQDDEAGWKCLEDDGRPIRDDLRD